MVGIFSDSFCILHNNASRWQHVTGFLSWSIIYSFNGFVQIHWFNQERISCLYDSFVCSLMHTFIRFLWNNDSIHCLWVINSFTQSPHPFKLCTIFGIRRFVVVVVDVTVSNEILSSTKTCSSLWYIFNVRILTLIFVHLIQCSVGIVNEGIGGIELSLLWVRKWIIRSTID